MKIISVHLLQILSSRKRIEHITEPPPPYLYNWTTYNEIQYIKTIFEKLFKSYSLRKIWILEIFLKAIFYSRVHRFLISSPPLLPIRFYKWSNVECYAMYKNFFLNYPPNRVSYNQIVFWRTRVKSTCNVIHISIMQCAPPLWAQTWGRGKKKHL